MDENPYSSPEVPGHATERSHRANRILQVFVDAVIVLSGALMGAGFCTPVIMSPPPPTMWTFVFAWLMGAVGAVVGGVVFALIGRFLRGPRT